LKRTYDKAGLLLSIKEEGKAEVINDSEYTYDESGNVTIISGTGNTTAITQNINCEMKYDAANRLICYNNKEITYDADGNMLQGVVAGEVTTLKYDCRNRLTKAGGTTYKYNAEIFKLVLTNILFQAVFKILSRNSSYIYSIYFYMITNSNYQTLFTIYNSCFN